MPEGSIGDRNNYTESDKRVFFRARLDLHYTCYIQPVTLGNKNTHLREVSLPSVLQSSLDASSSEESCDKNLAIYSRTFAVIRDATTHRYVTSSLLQVVASPMEINSSNSWMT